MSNKAFIAKPNFYALRNLQLHYTDTLTYVTIRSYLNNKTNQCFPSYETIADRMDASVGFVTESIKRLFAAKYINVLKSQKAHVSNRYLMISIKEMEKFDRIPYSIFQCTDLSMYEKSMLMLLRQFTISESMDIRHTLKAIAESLGLTYKVVYTQVKPLIEKGYIDIKNPTKALKFLRLTNKIDWHYDDHYSANIQPEDDHSLILTIT